MDIFQAIRKCEPAGSFLVRLSFAVLVLLAILDVPPGRYFWGRAKADMSVVLIGCAAAVFLHVAASLVAYVYTRRDDKNRRSERWLAVPDAISLGFSTAFLGYVLLVVFSWLREM